MYTIFFYYKLCRAVDIFQNLCRPIAIRAVNIFLSKSETARNTRTEDDFSWFLIFEQLTKKVTFARMVSSRFFEQTNFEQMIMTHYCYLVFFFLAHQSNFQKFMVRLKKVASIFVLFLDIFHRKLSQKKTNVNYKETSVASNSVNKNYKRK